MMQRIACRVLCQAGLVLLLAGCASFHGAPDPINTTQPLTDACPTSADIQAFDGASASPVTGESKKQWRDRLVADCIARADSNYQTFIRDLRTQAASVDLGADLLALGLTGGASLATKSTAHVLSTASTAVIGAGAAANKDLFYQETLPALIAAMDANRAAVFASIRTSEQADENTYTLEDAVHDIKEYEAAGSIDRAVKQITAMAQNAQQQSNAKVQALFTAQIVDSDIQVRRVKLASYIRTLNLSSDRAKLDSIATALGIPTNTTAPIERGAILAAISRKATDKVSMDALSALLKPQTQQDF